MQGHPNSIKTDQGYSDDGCSRHMTSNKSYLSNFIPFEGQYVSFGGGIGGKISGKELSKLETWILKMYYVIELKYNLFSVSLMCEKKNKVLFTDNECFVLSKDYKLPDESKYCLKFLEKATYTT